MTVTATSRYQVHTAAMLRDLQRLVGRLEDDLRERSGKVSELDAKLRGEYREARGAERTNAPFESWRDDYLNQVAVAWVLSCVFVRYLEDNAFLAEPYLAGPGEALQRARDRHLLFFRDEPTASDRDYLHHVFAALGRYEPCRELFAEDRNPLWQVGLSGDGAKDLLEFWQAIDPASGALLRQFGPGDVNQPPADTRFLGDLYQDLSEHAQKRYALLQTPDFVEEFILDRTLEPAVRDFGLEEVRLIDPTCGSGHFLLGAFWRLFGKWRKKLGPGANERDLAQKALDGVWGVDLNPFAVAIARFRLLLAALEASDLRTLAGTPGFTLHMACGDSLLHGVRFTLDQQLWMWPPDPYAVGDYERARTILSQRYHAVVGNPPYIIDRDRAHNAAVRKLYPDTAYQKFSLGVPFTERFFELAVPGSAQAPAGRVGMITANSFMKREFGSKLIENFFPSVDLTHVIDTSGAYIPGHGTPTVILFGRNRRPPTMDGRLVRAVLGIRGEPSTPEDAAEGKVWRSIVDLLDQEGAENDFVTIADLPAESFGKHPWSLAGGGAVELKELVESAATCRLGDKSESIGIVSFTLEDDVYLLPEHVARRRGLSTELVREMVIGEALRDWSQAPCELTIFPYRPDYEPIEESPSPAFKYLWPYRSNLANNILFGGKTKVEGGLRWYEFGRLTATKLLTPLSIAFAFVATHNHFVLDRGGKVFNRSAPIIKLPEGSTEEEHLALLGLLNSSVACFWFKATGHNKGSTVDQHGARQRTIPFEDFWEISGSQASKFPVPPPSPEVLGLARRLDALAQEAASLRPASPDCDPLAASEARWLDVHVQMVALQEELDWHCYDQYGALDETPLAKEALPPIRAGERAFEIVLARKLAQGTADDAWFRRHRIEPVYELPPRWPQAYREIVQRRIQLIEEERFIRLLEQPEYKRRWAVEPWQDELQRVLRSRLLDRLEHSEQWNQPQLTTIYRLANDVRNDGEFLRLAQAHAGRQDVDLPKLVAELVGSEAVPYLPQLRYKASGLRKRAQWERTWELQRAEDRGEKVGKIPVPPRYTSADFQSSDFWRLRGKLDVPKERFVSYPGAEREADPSTVVGWAGWDARQQAQALASYFVERKETEGWPTERLQPLLLGVLELVPWVKQWHNELDPEMGLRLGDYFESFVEEEARALGMTLEALRRWEPPKKKGRRKKR